MLFKRSDGRTNLDLRPLTISLSTLSRADGSCNFAFGDLKVLGSMTGPAEVKVWDEKPKEATVEVNVLPISSLPGPSNKFNAQFIKSFISPILYLEQYPRSLIQINLQTLSKPSERWSSLRTSSILGFEENECMSERAALMNASSIACLDGGVGMSGVGIAVAVAVVKSELVEQIGEDEDRMEVDEDQKWVVLLDPSPAEEAQATSLHLIGYQFGPHQTPSKPIIESVRQSEPSLCFCESYGAFDPAQLKHVFKVSQTGISQIYSLIRTSLEHQYLQTLNRPATLNSSNLPPPPPSTTPAPVTQTVDTTKQKKKKKDKTNH
ncbi:3' exoribonuclease family, domain 1-domain-containing protein [Melampsora americana]|nr:3' exoribonuclease family, domain 1-domain-containing protein [Melampsora americana]